MKYNGYSVLQLNTDWIWDVCFHQLFSIAIGLIAETILMLCFVYYSSFCVMDLKWWNGLLTFRLVMVGAHVQIKIFTLVNLNGKDLSGSLTSLCLLVFTIQLIQYCEVLLLVRLWSLYCNARTIKHIDVQFLQWSSSYEITIQLN